MISEFGARSHIPEFVRGRHTGNITPLEKWMCPSCKVVDTEINFLFFCTLSKCIRRELFSKVRTVDACLKGFLPVNKVLDLMTSSNAGLAKCLWYIVSVHLKFTTYNTNFMNICHIYFYDIPTFEYLAICCQKKMAQQLVIVDVREYLRISQTTL